MTVVTSNKESFYPSETFDPGEIVPDALIMLARIALHKGLGARWMKSKIGTMIDDMIYDDPDAQHYVIEYEPPDADARRQGMFS